MRDSYPLKSDYITDPKISIPILASFPLVTLPLLFLTTLDSAVVGLLFTIYAVLASAHNVSTFSIFLNGENLRHFRSSGKNIFLYFGVPAAIFGGLILASFCPLQRSSGEARAVFGVFACITSITYFHVLRQTNAVLQMFKRGSLAAFSKWTRGAESCFFILLWVLQSRTAIDGLRPGADDGRFVCDLFGRSIAGLCGLLLVAILAEYRAAWSRATRKREVSTALLYFVAQSGAAVIPIYRNFLAPFSFATHMVEYQLLMSPRLFCARLDTSSRIDAAARWLRDHRIVFAMIVVVAASLFRAPSILRLFHVSIHQRQMTFLAIYSYTAMSLTHSFLDTFLWKFSAPYYGRTLAPLYFNDVSVIPSPTPRAATEWTSRI